MSVQYGDKVIHGPILCDTPSNNEIIAMIPSSGFDYSVFAVSVVIETAGAQSTGTIVVETAEASPTAVATVATGTAVADTNATAYPVLTTEANLVPAAKGLQLKYSGTTDGSLRCWITVVATPSFE